MIALACTACDDRPGKSTVSMDSKAGRPAPKFKGEQQAELLAKAAAETKAGNVEPAIAAYLEAEKLGTLNSDDARAFAAALRTNGEALMTKGEARRALANYTKAISVAPEEKENSVALDRWLVKWDEGNALYSEDALATSVNDDLPDQLPAAVKTAIAGVYINHAKRLATGGRAPLRATRVFDLAKEMDPEHAQLAAALAEAEPKLTEQVRTATEITAAVDEHLTRHPGDDGVAVVAKRRKLDQDEVRAAVETIAAVRQGLLATLQATSWEVVAGVEAKEVRGTKLGDNTAEIAIILTGCDSADHALLSRAALEGIIGKLPAGVDSLRAPISYKGLGCGLTSTGLVATWRRHDGKLVVGRAD